jgi:hypothetical protein
MANTDPTPKTVAIVVAWAALGTSLALALGGRIKDPVEVEVEAAAGAAV